jgi:hypothetical protein
MSAGFIRRTPKGSGTLRFLLLNLVFAMLCFLDAATTIYLHENFPSGKELNPYVDPGSWAGLLLAPVKLLVYSLFVVSLMLSEKNSRKIAEDQSWLSDTLLLAYFPIFLIFIKVLAILNNLMPVAGISTPISHVLMMKNVPGDESLHYSIFWSAAFLLLAPLGLYVVKYLYKLPLKSSPQTN